jgi:hypothetical protein
MAEEVDRRRRREQREQENGSPPFSIGGWLMDNCELIRLELILARVRRNLGRVCHGEGDDGPDALGACEGLVEVVEGLLRVVEGMVLAGKKEVG